MCYAVFGSKCYTARRCPCSPSGFGWKFLLENDKIHPENDIRALGDDKMEIRYRWFYEKYFPEEMAELAAH